MKFARPAQMSPSFAEWISEEWDYWENRYCYERAEDDWYYYLWYAEWLESLGYQC